MTVLYHSNIEHWGNAEPRPKRALTLNFDPPRPIRSISVHALIYSGSSCTRIRRGYSTRSRLRRRKRRDQPHPLNLKWSQPHSPSAAMKPRAALGFQWPTIQAPKPSATIVSIATTCGFIPVPPCLTSMTRRSRVLCLSKRNTR